MATKLNLRKAAALNTVLQDMLKNLTVVTTIDLNEFQDPATAIATANALVFTTDSRRNDVLMSIYSIRSMIGVQNTVSGVNSRLSHIAYIDKRIHQLESMIDNAVTLLDITVIQGKLDKIKTRPTDSRAGLYGHTDEVRTGVLTTEQIENIRGVVRDLRKQKSTLNDEILELNIKTELELTPDVEAVLTREGLI